MKRHAALRLLSADHHHALVAAKRLLDASASRVDLRPAIDRFLDAWAARIAPHLRIEEEILLPRLACQVGDADASIVMTLTDHVALRRFVGQLRQGDAEELRAIATGLARRLEEHVRFEERTLFPAVEAALGHHELATLASLLAETRDQDSLPRS